MDTRDKKLDKEVHDDRKSLVLQKVEELKSLGVSKFEEINLNLYNKVTVSYDVANYQDLFKQAFSLSIPTKIFIIQRYITIDRKNRVLKLFFNGKTWHYFYCLVAQNPEEFEKVVVTFKSQSKRILNQFVVKFYAQQFPNLKLLTLNITASNQLAKDVIENRIEFIQHFKYIENVDILLNDAKIIKRKDNIQIEQILSSQKYLNINFKNENKIKVAINLNKEIDLTNEDNIKLIRQLIEENSSSDFIQTPRVIKLFANNNSIKEAKQIVENFPNINSVSLFSQKNNADDQDIYESFKKMIQSIQKLKKISFSDEKKLDFLQSHSNIISICQQKFNNFKVVWLNKQYKMIMYHPIHKQLKIVFIKDYQHLLKSASEDEFKQIFQLYSDVEKISIKSEKETVQNAIKQLHLLSKLKNVKIYSEYREDPLDFKPIYHINLEKIKLIQIDSNQYQINLLNLKSIQSLLNHPKCGKIFSNTFRFNNQIKKVYLEIQSFNQSELFADLILSKYQDSQNINVLSTYQIIGHFFFAKILFAPSLQRINIQNRQHNSQTESDKQLLKIFYVIQIYRILIKVIEKHIIDFIPIYLPSLIYDLFC